MPPPPKHLFDVSLSLCHSKRILMLQLTRYSIIHTWARGNIEDAYDWQRGSTELSTWNSQGPPKIIPRLVPSKNGRDNWDDREQESYLNSRWFRESTSLSEVDLASKNQLSLRKLECSETENWTLTKHSRASTTSIGGESILSRRRSLESCPRASWARQEEAAKMLPRHGRESWIEMTYQRFIKEWS